MQVPDFVPNLIDQEPVVAMGCTAKEFRYGFLISFVTAVLVTLLLGLITFGAWGISLGFGAVSSFLSFIGALRFFSYANRTHVPGYYIFKLQIWLEENGFGTANFEHKNNYYRSFRQ